MKPEILKKEFKSRSALKAYLIELHPDLDHTISPYEGTLSHLEKLLDEISPKAYAKTRNYLSGKVTHLSPFISRGMITPAIIYNHIKTISESFDEAEKLIQEVVWRIFWQKVLRAHPNWAWENAEAYKTGWHETDYATQLPEDILQAKTNCACINHFIKTLYETGYLHNHARMYVASYVIHWRKISWQVGAKWFLDHLLDHCVASNNLSWQWVASTFGNKPYIFNLENVQKYATEDIDTSAENNQVLHDSYENLKIKLFPNL